MNDASKMKPSHVQRTAFVYIRQSSPAQVEHNRESTARQYALVEKACQLGWTKEQVIVIDEDLADGGKQEHGSGAVSRTTGRPAEVLREGSGIKSTGQRAMGSEQI